MAPKILSVLIAFLSIAAFMGAGCGDFSVYGTNPTADAGAGGDVSVGSVVNLDGSASEVGDVDLATYSWSFNTRPVGSSAAITDEDTAEATATFTPDIVGTYGIRLTVTDINDKSDSATVTYTAHQGPDADTDNTDCENAAVGEPITLDGSASTDDGEIVTWEWIFSDIPTESAAEITDDDLEEPTATFTPDVCGDYVIELTVTDDDEFTGTDTLTCSISCNPTADAGAGGEIAVDEEVLLDGSASSDGDGTIVSWAWDFFELPEGSSAVIIDEDTEEPTATFTPDLSGAYVVELTVTDDDDFQGSTTVTYTAGSPVAEADVSGIHLIGEIAILRSTSYDNGGAIVAWNWTFESSPSAEDPIIENADQDVAYFIPDACGDHIVNLTVTDNDGLTDSTTVTYNVLCNPVAVGEATGSHVVDEVAILISTSSDSDGEIKGWDWAFESTPSVIDPEIGNADQDVAYFTPDVCGNYFVKLTVTDDDELTGSTTVKYNVCVPDADAGAGGMVVVGEQVFCDGSASTDGDGDLLSWVWDFSDKPAGSTAAITDADIGEPTAFFTPDLAGDYVVALTVTDNEGYQDTETAAYMAVIFPVADAGDDRSIFGLTATLDGSDSYDDGTIVTWEWEIVSTPISGSAEITDEDPSEPTATFLADTCGNYEFRLTVTDDLGLQDTDRVTYTMGPCSAL